MKTSLLLTQTQLRQTPWLAILCFYVLACGISYALRNVANPTEGILPRHVIFTYGLGPIVAALLTRRLFPNAVPTVGLLGKNPVRTVLFVLAPLVLGTVAWAINKTGQNPHLYGLLVVVSGVLYGLVEEAGWRGFLDQALQPLPTFWRVLTVGTLWFGWHFTFLPDTSSVAGPNTPPAGVVWLIMILASWGLGAAIKTTGSVLVAATLHESMNLVGHPVALALMLLAWTLLLKYWDRPLGLRLGRLALLLMLAGGFAAAPVGAVMAQDEVSPKPIPHEEIVPDRATNFTLFDKAFYENQLFLLGESHGVQKPQVLDFELLKHLNERVGVRYYVAEVDQSKAYYLNEYLKTGNDSTLMKVFRSWIATKAQWANRDFWHKIGRIRVLNQTLPREKQIRFLGIDQIQERRLVGEHLTELLAGRKLSKRTRALADTLLARLLNRRPDSLRAEAAQTLLSDVTTHENHYQTVFGATLPDLKHLLNNVVYLKTIRSRERTIFTNFQTLVQTLSLQNEKLYGFWGYFHVLQAPVEGGAKPFAALVRESNLPMRDKVVSITCAYIDCQMMLLTAYLPPMWQNPGKTFSRVGQLNNNGPMMYTEGIDTLMALSKPNTLTLFQLNETAAGQQPTRVQYSAFMPKEQQLQLAPNRPTTDYFQYLILVRNSDMTEPIEP